MRLFVRTIHIEHLLDERVERALLTDFGLARAEDDACLTRGGFHPGTPHYYVSRTGSRGSSDLFSQGCVLYALVSYHANIAKRCPPPTPRRWRPDWSATRKNREAMPSTAPASVEARLVSYTQKSRSEGPPPTLVGVGYDSPPKPFLTAPNIIRSNRPNIKAIHPKPQSPMSQGHLIHIRQNNLESRLTVANPQGEMNMVR